MLEKKFVFNKDDRQIVVAGHRGIRSHFPENTMLSYKKAIEIGVDQLEIDINVTRDGRLVLIHDTSVDRTTNKTGYVREFSYDEIKSLDAGSHLSSEFSGEKIPLFSELLEYIQPLDITLNVEIKDRTHECVDKTIALLNEYKMKDRFVIACWDASIIRYAYTKYNVRTQGFPSSIWDNYDDSLKYAYSIGIPMNMLCAELSEYYLSKDIEPWCWCPDDPESVLKAVKAGARLMTCNDPQVALDVLRKMGLHD